MADLDLDRITSHPGNRAVIDTLKWLVDPSSKSRGSGRTMMLAIAFIEAAQQNPRTWIELFDHAGMHGSYDRIESYIKSCIGRQAPESLECFEFNKKAFRFVPAVNDKDYFHPERAR
jgi:hypothetical protein